MRKDYSSLRAEQSAPAQSREVSLEEYMQAQRRISRRGPKKATFIETARCARTGRPVTKVREFGLQ